MFKRILLAYNGTPEGQSGLLACAEIAAFSSIETHLLAVARLPAGAMLADGVFSADVVEAEEKRMQAILDEGLLQLKRRGFNATGHIATGEPVNEICWLASELDVDLIIVGHKRKATFASRWWGGSIGKTLLDDTPCSVFIARTG